MEKIFIQNRDNLKIAVLVEKPDNAKGLVIIEHGLGGYKEQLHIEAMSQVFQNNQYIVIRFDTTNSFGESDGKYEDATTTKHYEDLEDVIEWTSNQEWYQEPFVLAGHSLGGISTALYAENFPEKVKGVAPISTIVSGRLSFEVRPKEELENWEKTGWFEEESFSKKGLIKRLPWSHMEDRLKYNLLEKIDKLTMPVLLIVGDQDRYMPQQKILYDKLSGDKELHIIKDAPHTFRKPEYLKEIKQIFDKWIKNKL